MRKIKWRIRAAIAVFFFICAEIARPKKALTSEEPYADALGESIFIDAGTAAMISGKGLNN